MKRWFREWCKEFWDENGARFIFIGILILFCLYFIYNTTIPLKNEAKDILLMITGALIVKIRTPDRVKKGKKLDVPETDVTVNKENENETLTA